MTTTVQQSPSDKTREAAAVFRVARLESFSTFDHHYGHHVRILSTGGSYIVTPATGDLYKVRWIPETAPAVALGLVDTAARAAGLVLDHKDGLLP